MNKKSDFSSMKDLVKQFLYTETENTNTDRAKTVEVDACGNKAITNKAGVGPENKNRINDKYQSEGIGRPFK